MKTSPNFPTASELIDQLRAAGSPVNVAGMARFGINPTGTLGVSIPTVRALAKGVRSHALAEELWQSGIHEARLLASMVDDPTAVTEDQMERWALDFDSWDVVDQVCSNLFDRMPFAHAKALEWSAREEEFVKRAGFVLMACLAMHDKSAPNSRFLEYFPAIRREATDPRNFVKKAVNWALRGIGKRSRALNADAVELARELVQSSSPVTRWIASDALRELTDPKILARIKRD